MSIFVETLKEKAMNKQEFLAMSLPYGIYLLEDAHISKLEGIVQGYYLIDYNEIGTEERDDVLPVLHPLPDLTKPIEHKGEKFVPMIELAKIEGIGCDGIVVVKGDYKGYVLNSGILEFVYSPDNNSFQLSIGIPSMDVDNQLSLFQKLVEWHFDLADLISKGEAIDVNTLEANPYK